MCDDHKKPQDPSRRTFIRNVGAGIIGSTLVPDAVAATGDAEEPAPTAHQGEYLLDFTVNGTRQRLMVAAETTLVQVLRDTLGLIGTKIACNRGQCGSCTVLMNGNAVYSCHVLALDAMGTEITTVEGLMNGENLHPIQEAFVEEDGLQCGFCTPGQVMTAAGLLNRHPHPTTEQIETGMSGTLCRCAAYPNIRRSVETAAKKLNGKGVPS